MSNNALDSGLMEDNYTRTAKRVGGLVALGLSVAASGYGLYRIVRGRRSPLKAAQKNVELWLDKRLVSLQKDLHLTHDEAKWMRKQIASTTRTVFSILHKAEHLNHALRDSLHLIAEKKFLVMKLRVHNHINLEADTELDLLHKFHSELWLQMFPSVSMTTILG